VANPAGVGQMAEEIGDIFEQRDRDAVAALRYLAAAEAFRAADLPVDALRARRKQAISLLWCEDVEAALGALATADELSLTLPRQDQAGGEQAGWERARLLYDGARILRGADRIGEATVRAGNAAACFRGLDHPAQATYAQLLHVELLLQDDRPGQAEASARRALAEVPADTDGWQRLNVLLHQAIEAQRPRGD